MHTDPWWLRIFAERRIKRLELGLHQPAGGGGQNLGQPLGRGMRPVGRGKCVVDIDIAKCGQRGGNIRVVCLLPGMETQVFQERHLARAEIGNDRMCGIADAVLREGDRYAAQRFA